MQYLSSNGVDSHTTVIVSTTGNTPFMGGGGARAQGEGGGGGNGEREKGGGDSRKNEVVPKKNPKK